MESERKSQMYFRGLTVRSAVIQAVSSYRSPTTKQMKQPTAKQVFGYGTNQETDQCGRPRQSIAQQQAGAVEDFQRNKRLMEEAGFIGADKYFHCVANCQATRRGPHGEAMARTLSNSREWLQDRWPGSHNDAAADQEANRAGREGARRDPCGSCDDICFEFRPNPLPGRFWAD